MEEEIATNEEIKKEEISVSNPYLIPGSIVVAGFIVAMAVVYSKGGFTDRAEPSRQNAAAVVASSGQSLADDDPVLGNPDAPVTIVEFGDFQCPYCAQFFRTTEQELIEKYIKTGKARLIYRDFPLNGIHEHAQKAAEASECADEQGNFWAYHDLLYTRQASLGMENFKLWAKEIGLNSEQFNSCLDSGKYSGEVLKDFQDGQAAGVTGTPASFVNGKSVSGAVPFSVMASEIEAALKTAQ